MVSAAVLKSEKSALQAVEKLGDTLRKGGRLTVEELIQVEKAYHTLMKGLSSTERALEQARAATHNLESAREFLVDVTLSEMHLAGMRRLTPELLVDLKALSKTNGEMVGQLLHAAGESQHVAWGAMYLRSTVRQDHLLHMAAWLGDDVMAQLGRGTVTVSEELTKLVQKERNLQKAYETLM